MAEVMVGVSPSTKRPRRAVAAWIALGLVLCAATLGLIGYRIGTDAIHAGCTVGAFHNSGQTLIGWALAVLAPLAFIIGLVAAVRRGPRWSRVMGAAVMAIAVALVVVLISRYWDYTCSL